MPRPDPSTPPPDRAADMPRRLLRPFAPIASLASFAAWLLAAASLPGLLPGTALAQRVPVAADDADGARVIVKYKALGGLMRAAAASREAMHGPQHAATMARRSGLALSDGRVVDARTQVLRARGLSSQQLATRLAADDEVEYAVPDLRRRALAAPSDPRYAGGAGISPAAGQWYLRAPDATFLSAINAAGAWAVTPGSPAVVVAVLDTGVRPEHEDLANQLLPGYDFIADLADARDGDGRDADASDPGDWSSANQCGAGEPAAASSWHGTKMAGLVAAQTDNGIGMAGVGRNVRLLPVRVLSACGGYDSDILAGMLWAGGLSANPVANPHPARVINLSLGSAGSCSAAYRDAVSQLTAAGVVVVAAAGNEEGLAVGTPANCPGVVAVAALRHAGSKVGFSSVGPEVAISAPGGNCVNLSGECLYPILTTTNAGLQGPAAGTYTDGNDYSVGTSFSTPLVAGTVALMLSANPALTPAQVRSQLQATARPFPAAGADPTVPQCRAPSTLPQIECMCTPSTCGAGMLDAAAAVGAAAATAAPSVSLLAGAGSVLAGGTVGFDGSATRVAGGRSIAAWRWAITSGSAIAAFVGDTRGPTVQVRTSGAGSFTVQLTVTDSAGVQASASANVSVQAPAAPVVRLLSSATVITAGGRVDFDASGSTAASGLAVAAWRWAITSGAELASITAGANEAQASVTTRGSSSGSITVQVTVTDSLGQEASASTSVGVTPVGPTASIQASAASVTAGAAVSFDAGGSMAPAGRSLSAWRWEITSGSALAAFSGGSSGPTATVATSGPGSFTVRLTVTDSAGAQDSRAASVTVQAAGGATGASGGSGGGAIGAGWLIGLALAVLALWRRPPMANPP
jgi:serine protease